jgi:WD40 repeat protein
VAFSANGRLLASGSADSTIRLWDPATGTCERVFEGHQGSVRALAVLSDECLASSSDDTIRLWDLTSGACERVFEGHQGLVMALAVLGDGRLASGSYDNNIIWLWDPASPDGAPRVLFVADAAITIGAVLLVLDELLRVGKSR